MPLKFQALDDWPPGPEHLRILLRGNPPEVTWTHLSRTPPEHLSFLAQPVPFDQGLIHREIPPGRILYKEREVRRVIEKLREQLQAHPG